MHALRITNKNKQTKNQQQKLYFLGIHDPKEPQKNYTGWKTQPGRFRHEQSSPCQSGGPLDVCSLQTVQEKLSHAKGEGKKCVIWTLTDISQHRKK